MFEALESMDHAALALAARMAGVRTDGSDAAVRRAIVQRLADEAGTRATDLNALDRECLHQISRTLHVESASGDTLAVEERLFGPLLARVATHTLPIWRLAACLAMLHPSSARSDCVGFVERIFRCALPAQAAVRALREAIETIPQPSTLPSGAAAADLVRGDILTIARHTTWIEPVLSLVIATACADGKFNKEEERFFHAVAERLGIPLERAQQMRETLTSAFWSRRARLAPAHTETPAEGRAHSLQAAYDLLETQGVLLSLKALVCEAVSAVVGRSDKATKGSWSFRLLGGLLGRSRDDDSLLRVALFAYLCRPAA